MTTKELQQELQSFREFVYTIIKRNNETFLDIHNRMDTLSERIDLVHKRIDIIKEDIKELK